MLSIIGAVLLGWSLGANDAANVFGTAVSARIVRWWTAAVLAAAFVILGAVLQGAAGVETLAGLTEQSQHTAAITVFAAAITVTIMTALKLPISTSQAVVGSIIGVGIMQGQVNLDGLGKVIACWLGTPFGAMVLYVCLHLFFAALVRLFKPSVFILDPLLRLGVILCGCYGAYALGANNVANVAGVLVAGGILSRPAAVLLGGVSIALGILTLSKPVMLTVGRRIVELTMFSAFIVVLASAATVHLYAWVGVPVSASQAVVGALLGISLLRGSQVVHWRALLKVGTGWIATPILACVLAILIYVATHLKYAG